MNSIAPDQAAAAITIDGLFRRAAIRDPDAIALADPPNKRAITGSEARILTYAEADRIIWRLTGRLREFGLPRGAVVAFQLPNTVESVVTLLAIARAGFVAAPLPLLWRKADIVAALAQTDAKALITASRVAGLDPLTTIMHSAASLFTVRHVCAFGSSVSHDVIGLDDVFEARNGVAENLAASHAQSADDPVAMTFNFMPDRPMPVPRTHRELQAGGLGWFSTAGIAAGANLLATIPITSFAGLATTLMGWLFCGGMLALHHPFDAAAFDGQRDAWPCHAMILPGPLAVRMSESLTADTAAVVALWSAPERLTNSHDWKTDAARLVDVSVFGETALWAAARGPNGRPAPIRPADLPTGTWEAVRTAAGTLALRGAMVPKALCRPDLADRAGPQTWADTRLPCSLDPVTGDLTVQGPPSGLIPVGGYRLPQADLDRIASDTLGPLVAVPDALNGYRLAGRLIEDQVLLEIEKNGVNHLILNAFIKRTAAERSLIHR